MLLIFVPNTDDIALNKWKINGSIFFYPFIFHLFPFIFHLFSIHFHLFSIYIHLFSIYFPFIVVTWAEWRVFSFAIFEVFCGNTQPIGGDRKTQQQQRT